MARTRTSNPEDKNTMAFKVNDRIRRDLKLLSLASDTSISVLLTHAAAEYIEKHRDTINECLAESMKPAELEMSEAAE